MALTSYGSPLTEVPTLKYLGRVLYASDNDCLTVIWKFQKARQKWKHLYWVIVWEGADARTLGIFYTVVVQVVLLYGSDLWVISLRIGKSAVRFLSLGDTAIDEADVTSGRGWDVDIPSPGGGGGEGRNAGYQNLRCKTLV